MQKITIKDIARMANVSPSTVSFVLNNREGISEETAERVRRICKETGFVPDINSRRLLLRKSFNINLVFDFSLLELDGLFYYDITKSIVAESHNTAYNIVISYLKKKDGKTLLPDSVYTGDSDGLIFFRGADLNVLQEADKIGVPYIVVDAPTGDTPFITISPDYENAMYKATEYLIEMGHRDIGFITIHTSPAFAAVTKHGFLRCLEEKGLSADQRMILECEDTVASARDMTSTLLGCALRPSAILCATDILAIGAMKATKQAGLSIPDDISFIGMNNIALSAFCEPRLTTMTAKNAVLGRYAFDTIMRAIEKKPCESILLPTKLIHRESVSAKRS